MAYANRIVKDTNTGLEWKAGPDKSTNWDKARSWMQSLNLDGGGWRMPTKDEVKSLYKAGSGSRNMTPLLKTTGWWVWSSETKNSPLETTGWRARFSDTKCSSYAWIFYFSGGGYGYWLDRSTSDNLRAFAVRSRSIGINSPKDAADEYQRDNRHEDVQPSVENRYKNRQDIDYRNTHLNDTAP